MDKVVKKPYSPCYRQALLSMTTFPSTFIPSASSSSYDDDDDDDNDDDEDINDMDLKQA